MTTTDTTGTAAAGTGPADWKNYDDFAAGIDGNRLPNTPALAGRRIEINDDGGGCVVRFGEGSAATWQDADGERTAWYEAVEARPGLFFATVRGEGRPRRADVLVLHTGNGRTLRIVSRIAEVRTPGRPQVEQDFHAGVLAGADVRGAQPAPTRDLIGLRALYRYSPEHLYEHIYLSSERYAWQCLVGEQRGHGDVDLASTWKIAEDLYVFTFREFIIPVAATWLYDFAAARTTGTFVGLAADGTVRIAPGGALITQLGRARYPDEQPV